MDVGRLITMLERDDSLELNSEEKTYTERKTRRMGKKEKSETTCHFWKKGSCDKGEQCQLTHAMDK